MIKEFAVKTDKRNEFVYITEDVNRAVKESGVKEGICVVFCPHTTAGITINEGADPDVVNDMLRHLEKMIPEDDEFKHTEGNSDSHIKSSLVGTSETLIIRDGKLVLGAWQSIYFAEFDGPRNRKVFVKILEN